MDRRRFLVAVAGASTALAAPHALFASTAVAHAYVVRGQPQRLIGVPGGCAGSRRGAGTKGLDVVRMLTFR